MPQRSKPGVNWDSIRQRYEAGESANGIAKSGVNVSKQAILGRVKRHGWKQTEAARQIEAHRQVSQQQAAMLAESPTHSQWMTARHGKDTPETRTRVLQNLGLGATYDLAAKAAGISHVTLADWRKRDPHFADQCDMARAQKAVDHIGVIDHAGLVTKDWKASEAFLRRHEATKADWADQAKAGGPTINVMLQVARGTVAQTHGVTIDMGEVIEAAE